MFCKLIRPIVSLEAGCGNILVLARKLESETDWKKIWRKSGRSTWASDKPRALGSILFLCRLCQTWSISGHECTDKSLNHEILQFTLYLFFCDRFSFKILASGGSLLNHSLPIQIIWVFSNILFLLKPVSSGVASRSSCFPPEGGFSVGRRGTKSGGLGVRQPGKLIFFLLLSSTVQAAWWNWSL